MSGQGKRKDGEAGGCRCSGKSEDGSRPDVASCPANQNMTHGEAMVHLGLTGHEFDSPGEFTPLPDPAPRVVAEHPATCYCAACEYPPDDIRPVAQTEGEEEKP